MRHVLIAEDEPNLLSVLVETFEYEGFQVSAARDGAEAIERLESRPAPDVILLDLIMPRKDGWAVLEHLQSMPELKRIPVILVTAIYAGPDSLPPRDHYHTLIQKPYDLEELLATVSQIVEAQRSAE